ncbi:SAVMC3_10250 family protein [Streptomyces sp. NBC_00286]|uniref:SAVMC3_10250 family protein n=1 Tax=Streptomyces sp. NBC_00286 TaxID=2975701 RepID=UPI002E2D16B0|nr:SAVMC3_10250 family protein [Streptomyces sp. NBC_00286]
MTTLGAELREVIYLSDGKLRQFLTSPRRVPRASALRLNTPLGGVDLDAATADDARSRLRHLQEVDNYLATLARWFAEPDLRPGQWVQFEAPLRCVTLRGQYRHLTLFADPGPGEEPDHERATGCRLLMHGSVRHLVGHLPEPVDGPPLEELDGGGHSAGTTFMTNAGRVVRALAEQEGGDTAVASPEGTSTGGNGLGGSGVRDLLHAIDARTPAGTAAWMRGYARVTALLPAKDTNARCLVASPLTVEYAR